MNIPERRHPTAPPEHAPSALARHWDAVFSREEDSNLGWYEASPHQTLRMLQCVRRAGPMTVFLPGAGTSVLVDELLNRGHRLVLNDISEAALAKLRARLGGRDGLERQVVWVRHDMAEPLPAGLPACNLWIDRAVLHFFTEERCIQRYFANLRQLTAPGGHVLLAEFSYEAPSRCAGLPVRRYTLEEMVERMGEDFELIAFEHYTTINPRGETRPYLYGLFRRIVEDKEDTA